MQTTKSLTSAMAYAAEWRNSPGFGSLEQCAEVSDMVRMFQ